MKNLALALLILACVTPLAFAHRDGGIGVPKPYCEWNTGDYLVHDYGPPSSGHLVALGSDGNTEDCNPHGYPARAHGYPDPFWNDGIPADVDRHFEFGLGGAWLPADETRAIPCGWDLADHAPMPVVSVSDFGSIATASVAFWVAVDAFSVVAPPPGGPDCGDGDLDLLIACVNSCQPNFLPGLDGSYVVLVQGTYGHIYASVDVGAEVLCQDGQHVHALPAFSAVEDTIHPYCTRLVVVNDGPGALTVTFRIGDRLQPAVVPPVPGQLQGIPMPAGADSFEVATAAPEASVTWQQGR